MLNEVADGVWVRQSEWVWSNAVVVRADDGLILVDPLIKRALCQGVRGDRSWLKKIRPWPGHADHFHVRLLCPPGATQCVDQAPVPAGDGCGKDLDYWFTSAPYKPTPPSPPLTILRRKMIWSFHSRTATL